jgi:hypothetical protein
MHINPKSKFLAVRRNAAPYEYRPEDGFVIVDAKPDNFIRANEGLLPSN